MTYTQNYILPRTERNTASSISSGPSTAATGSTGSCAFWNALHMDAGDWEISDSIDSILQQTWKQFASPYGPCSRHEDDFLLNSSAMGFAPMEKAWLCPSRGAFSTPSSSALSPYLPTKEQQPSQCLEYEIPLYPDAFGPTEENSVKAARAWLEEANGIQRLRQAGLWFADHDNVVMLTPYFRAQEHSAQLSSAELDKCTRQGRRHQRPCLQVEGNHPELAHSRFCRGGHETSEHPQPLEVPKLRQFMHGGQPPPDRRLLVRLS